MTQLSYLSLAYHPAVPAEGTPVTRRVALSSAALGMTSLSGCLGRLWSAWERDTPSQISLEIRTAPEDDDLYALRIARHLAGNLEEVGIQANVAPMRQDAFLREILINHNFEMFVWSQPAQPSPDALRTLLHSQFAEERGWQNPYGFSNSIVDGLLEAHVATNDEEQRLGNLAELLDILVDERPFIPIAFEEEHRLINREQVREISNEPFGEPTWLYGLGVEDDTETLALGSIDGRLTRNLNPIAVEFRGSTGTLGLTYESLVQRYRDGIVPWLAADWEWTSPAGGRIPTLRVELRDGHTWHDGEPVTSEDVAFTFRFLQDTSMTDGDPTIPSPRFRGATSLLEAVEAVDPHRVHLQFAESTRAEAERLLTVPILPAHIWEEWTEPTEVAGVPLDEVTTDALIEENLEPVGSGPYRVTDVSTDDTVRFELIEDHPFVTESAFDRPIPELEPPHPDEILIDIRPSVTNIKDAIKDGGLDGSLVGLGANYVAEAEQAEGITGIAQNTSRLYHVGFNVREGPALTHAGFRTAIESLIDRAYVRDEILQGAGHLTRSGIYDKSTVPESLQWNQTDEHRFAGEPGSGEVDPEQARQAFRDAGFSFSEDGDLLVT